MSEIIKQKLISITEAIHLRVFGHKMSPTMSNFLGHLSWSFLGIFFNGLILFAVNVLAGRILGPEGYGKYNLVLVIMNILSIFILLGLDITSIKYISSSKEMEDKKQYLSNSFFIVLFSSFIIFVFFLIFSSQLSGLFHLDKNIFLLAAVFAIIISLRTLLDSFVKSFNFFKFQSVAKIIEGFIILLFFALFFFVFKFDNYQYYIFSLSIGYIVICIVYFMKIKGKIVVWNKEKIKDITKYSKTTIILTIIGIIMVSMDKIFVGKTLGVQQLGIYSAYLVSTSIFVGQIILVFDNVFFPTINQLDDKNAIIKKADKLFFLGLIPGTLIMFLFSFIIMLAFGEKYQLNVFYILAFSLAAFLQIMGSLYKSIVSSKQKSYMRLKRAFYKVPFLFFLLYGLTVLTMHPKTLDYFVIIYLAYTFIYLFIVRKNCEKSSY